MSNVVSFEAKRQEHLDKHKEIEMTTKCRNLNALIGELSLVVNKHVNSFGATHWQSAGAAMYILAKALAEADPELKRPEIREHIHALLDTYTDEALVELWQHRGVP
jgi:hypothetical protein